MEKEKYIKVSAEVKDCEYPDSNIKVEWIKDCPYVHEEDMLDCLRTIMVGLTFSEYQFKRILVEYVRENAKQLQKEGLLTEGECYVFYKGIYKDENCQKKVNE